MIGWLTVTATAILEFVALAWFSRSVPRRRGIDYLLLAVVVVVLHRILSSRTGDMSVYFPSTAFSSGSEGKDQIVVLSALSSLLVPLTIAMMCVAGIGKWGKPKRKASQ
jgi:uncharacterized membrane protein